MSPAEERMLDLLAENLIEEGLALCAGLAELASRTADPKDRTLILFVRERLAEAYPVGVLEHLKEEREESTKDMC